MAKKEKKLIIVTATVTVFVVVVLFIIMLLLISHFVKGTEDDHLYKPSVSNSQDSLGGSEIDNSLSMPAGKVEGSNQNISDQAAGALADGQYKIAENNLFFFEYVKDWNLVEFNQGLAIEKEIGKDYPRYIISWFCTEDKDDGKSVGDVVAEKSKAYSRDYGIRVARQPEMVTYEIGERKIDGFTACYSSVDGSRTITTYELVEAMGGEIYTYSCEYMSQSYNENEYEDETTYFEFMHAIETLKFK